MVNIVKMVSRIINATFEEDGVLRRLVLKVATTFMRKSPMYNSFLKRCGEMGHKKDDMEMIKILSNMFGGPKVMKALASVMLGNGFRPHHIGPGMVDSGRDHYPNPFDGDRSQNMRNLKKKNIFP